MQLWQIHVAEQMIMDDMEINPDKYEGKKLSELTDEEEINDENSVEYTKAYYKEALLPKRIVVSTLSLAEQALFLLNRHKFLHFCLYASERERKRS